MQQQETWRLAQGVQSLNLFSNSSSWRERSVVGVAEGGDALLDVENQGQGARRPIALSVLGDDSLSQFQGTIFRLFGFFLVGFGFVDLDQIGAAPGGVV